MSYVEIEWLIDIVLLILTVCAYLFFAWHSYKHFFTVRQNWSVLYLANANLLFGLGAALQVVPMVWTMSSIMTWLGKTVNIMGILEFTAAICCLALPCHSTKLYLTTCDDCYAKQGVAIACPMIWIHYIFNLMEIGFAVWAAYFLHKEIYRGVLYGATTVRHYFHSYTAVHPMWVANSFLGIRLMCTVMFMYVLYKFSESITAARMLILTLPAYTFRSVLLIGAAWFEMQFASKGSSIILAVRWFTMFLGVSTILFYFYTMFVIGIKAKYKMVKSSLVWLHDKFSI